MSEICRRFRRYKNPVYATALDDEEDLEVGFERENIAHFSPILKK